MTNEAPQVYFTHFPGLAALGRSTKPAAPLVGGSDELFYPDRFAPLFKPVRPDIPIVIVPGVGHIGMTVTADGIAAVVQSFRDMTAPSPAKS